MVSLKFLPSKDVYVKEDDPDSNFNAIAGLFTQVATTSGYIRRSLLEFSLSSLIDVPIKNISVAKLTMYVGGTSHRVVDLRRIDNDTWTETGVTWNNQPTSTDYNVEETFTNGLDEKSILSIVKSALRDGHSYVGILTKYIDETSDGTNHYTHFYSKEWGYAPYRTYLEIEYDTYSQTALHGSLCKNLLFKDGFGEITMTDHNCPSPCDAATFTFKTAWGSTYTSVLLDVGDTQQYDSGSMHHSFKLYSMSAVSAPCDNLAAATIEEKYWKDDCYVKTTGDNDRNGTSWTEAWDTVTQAATETFDGQEVHIGFGTYSGESKTVPDNFGTTGIKYTPEAVGGGGTGSVTVPQ